MNRRNFAQLVGTTGLSLFSPLNMYSSEKSLTKYKFNLAYAPHLGMFRHHAGDDPIDQLNFIADHVNVFEDNEMRNLLSLFHVDFTIMVKEDFVWVFCSSQNLLANPT